MVSVLRQAWRALKAWRAERRLAEELPGLDRAIDTTDPDDAEQVAQFLWAATCWDRPRTDPSEYALAAVIWLNYGQLRLPPGASPLHCQDMQGLALPYGQRTGGDTVTAAEQDTIDPASQL